MNHNFEIDDFSSEDDRHPTDDEMPLCRGSSDDDPRINFREAETSRFGLGFRRVEI